MEGEGHLELCDYYRDRYMHVSLDRVDRQMVCHHGILHPNHCDLERVHHYEAASLGNHNQHLHTILHANHFDLSLDLLCDDVGDEDVVLGWRDPLRLVGLT